MKDFPSTAAPDSRAWRAALHRIADELEEAFTGVRGIARTRIAFERGRRIWVVDIDGEGAMPLSDAGTPMSPAWHPQGRAIAYATVKPAGISVLDLSSSRARTLVSGQGVFISPIFTPDGESVVYAHGVEAGVDLHTASLSGGGGRRLSVGRGSDNVSPSFSPDGRRIAFMSGRAGHPEIYTMDADGTNVDLLTPLAFGENPYRASPDWSPDGRLVAFQSHDRRQLSDPHDQPARPEPEAAHERRTQRGSVVGARWAPCHLRVEPLRERVSSGCSTSSPAVRAS